VSLDTNVLFKNNAPPLLQNNSPDVLYCDGLFSGDTCSFSFTIGIGQSKEISNKLSRDSDIIALLNASAS